MGVELHRVADDVGHLVVSAVVEALHRVEDAALHGFEAVAEVRHGAFEDDIGGVVEEPVLVHARELVARIRVAAFVGGVVGVGVLDVLRVVCFFAHRVFGNREGVGWRHSRRHSLQNYDFPPVWPNAAAWRCSAAAGVLSVLSAVPLFLSAGQKFLSQRQDFLSLRSFSRRGSALSGLG